MERFNSTLIVIGLAFLILAGCHPIKKPQPKADNKGKSKTGIIGEKTQDIGEFDPDEGNKVSDGKMKPTNPLNPLGAMNAYKPAVEKLAKIQIKHAVDLFNAAKGRYPKDHEEFMEQIIKANNISLPVLPGDWKYQYDVQNHELVVVEIKKEDDD